MSIGKVIGQIIGLLIGFVIGFILASYWNDPGVQAAERTALARGQS
jgi:tetrahydromethanopterin S-methyltransferase subunit G